MYFFSYDEKKQKLFSRLKGVIMAKRCFTPPCIIARLKTKSEASFFLFNLSDYPLFAFGS